MWCQALLCNPLDKLELARKVKLGKILIQIFDGCVVFAFHHDIPVDDLTALAVNDVDLGDKTVNSFIFYHTYNVSDKTGKSEKKNTIICVCSIAYKPISRTDIPPPAYKNPHRFVNWHYFFSVLFRGGWYFSISKSIIQIITNCLIKKNKPRVFIYMQDEQDMIWLKGMQHELKGCEIKVEDMKFLIKLLQDELIKTKTYISTSCRRPEFSYNKHVNKCLDWKPGESLRFITQI